jgi:DNA-binding transcriptional regulator YiaG
MKNYTFTREATAAEIRDYELVERLTKDMDDEEFSNVLTMLSDYFMDYGEARKMAYPKVYRFAKKLGVTVKTLNNWYFTEVC